MHNSIGFLTFLALGLWFAATVLAQLRGNPIATRLRRLDPLSFLPSWSFFAPNPGVRDNHLLYRMRLPDSSLSHWKELRLSCPRKVWHALWNPDMRQGKVLSDAVGMLTRLKGSMQPTGFKTTLPYLVLLNYVAGEASAMAGAVQFAIMESFPYAPNTKPRAVFLSEFHRLERESPYV